MQSVYNDASLDGIEQFRDSYRSLNRRNCSRDLRASFLKTSQWPGLYWAELRLADRRDPTREVREWAAFQTIYELIEMMFKYGTRSKVNEVGGMDPESLAHLRSLQQADPGITTGLGIHGDGVPCNWDRTKSCEVLSMNLPGLTGEWGKMRIPIVCIPHDRIGPNTWDDVMEVVRWMLQWAHAGINPTERHDEREWLPSDRRRGSHGGAYKQSRAAVAGRPLSYRAALVETRGDWKFFSEVFHFPYHNRADYMCWKCRCTRDQVRPSCMRIYLASTEARWKCMLLHIR